MAKAAPKTTETNNSVTDFLATVENEAKRADSLRIMEIFEEQTKLPAKMWGPAIIGYGSYHYKYASGHEGDAPRAGFSPRKQAITLYLAHFEGIEEMLQKLGKHKMSKACIYIQKLADIDVKVLKKMISKSMQHMKKEYPEN